MSSEISNLKSGISPLGVPPSGSPESINNHPSTLQAASVGFIPLKWEDSEPTPNHNLNPNQAWARRYTEQELLEVSAVGIPANPNALTLALRAGAVEQSDLRELFNLLKHLVGTACCAVRSDSASSFVVQPLGCSDSDSVPSVRSVSFVSNLLPHLRS